MGLRTPTSIWWLARLFLVAALLAPIFATTPALAAITFPIKINFQNAAAAVPAGYFRDFGEGYGLRTGANQGASQYTYGWIVPGSAPATPLDLSVGGTTPGNGRDRNLSTDQRLDTLMHMQADDVTGFNGTRAEGAWEIELPNGSYNVTVAVGDASVATPVERHYLRLEGQLVVNNFQASGVAGDIARHKIVAAQVAVADGKLTVDALGGYNTKINFIEISESNGQPPRPTIFGVNPANNATGVRRDTGVSATLTLPNGGLNGATVTSDNVYLRRTSDNSLVPANVNTSGGGDVLVLTPITYLEPNTSYTFVATDGVRDAGNQQLVPFSSTFTTGTAGGPGSNTSGIVFQQVRNLVSGTLFSSLTIGPDNKLYVATLTGDILRYLINPDGTLTLDRTISTIRTAEVSNRAIIGLAFDPAATPADPILWVSHNGPYVPENADDWTGKIARLSGPNLDTFQNYVVNLPHSYKDHMVNSLAFGPDGKLYVTVGSNSAMGSPDSAWGNRPERLLSASVLRIDQAAITSPPLDVKTEEGGSYNPFAANAPVKFYATGVRNAYDLTWHSNGQLYVATNSSARGGNIPGTPGTLPAACQNRIDDAVNGDYTGPVVPARFGVADQRDYLYRVVQGKYYGHPNPLRCEWAMNNGNPTAGVDLGEVVEYPVGTLADRNYGGISFDFDVHKSPNGMLEYKSGVFNNALKGKLLVVRYSDNDDIIVLNPGSPTKDISESEVGLPGLIGLTNPLDLVEDSRNGNVYVVEHGASSKIALLRPLVGSVPTIALDKSTLVFTDVAGGAASASQTITLSNQGTAQLNISGATLAGANADQFNITQQPPSTVAQGGTGTLQVNFNPTSVGPKLAVLRIASDAVNAPTIEVTLRGLGAAGLGGTNEPSLQWILDTYEYKVNVGDPDPADNALPTSALLGEEVALQRFERADNANPVIIEPLAIFGPTGSNPVTQFGWYTSGNAAGKTQLFQVTNSPASNGQRLAPALAAGATLNFDPGTASFGFYSIWPFFANREVFSEDALNTFSGAVPHHVRVYPLKDASGSTIENSYIVAFEETTSNHDYQDVVVIVRNVRPFGSGPVAVPGAPTNLSAVAADRQVTLSWTPASGAVAASYAIYRSTTATVVTTGTPLGTSATTSYTDTGLTNGTTYYYAVVALNSAGQASGPSNTASATPFAASGTIEVVNPDKLPYNDWLTFYRIEASARKTHRRIDLQVFNRSTTQPLRVFSPTITGPDATSFTIALGAAGLNIPAGESRIIRIDFTGGPDLARRQTSGEHYAFLNISSTDASNSNIKIQLAGFNQDRVGGSNEPTMQQIFNVFGYGSVARYPSQGGTQFGQGVFGSYGDEVLSTNGLWTRASPDQPVYVRHIVATHGDTNGRAWDASFRFTGTCTATPDPDNIPNNTQTCAFWNNGPDWHEFLPPIYVAATSPTSNTPAEMFAFPTGNFQVISEGYSSNAHTNNPIRAQTIRLWALRDRNGAIVPNSYLVGQDYAAFGSTSANWDYQDNVYLVTNIRPADAANDTTVSGLIPGSDDLVLEFNRAYPGSLLDAQGETTGFRETQRNEIGGPGTAGVPAADVFRPDLAPTTSYDPSKLDIDTSGSGTLKITTTDGSNANTLDTLVNGLCMPFNARLNKWVMQTRLVAPLTLASSVQQAGLMFGPNTYEYVKLALQSSSGGRLSLQFAYEQDFNTGAKLNDVSPVVSLPATGTITSLDLRFTGDPTAGTVEAAYSVNGAAFVTLPNKLTLATPARGRFFDRNGNGCILAFNRTPAPAYTATFERFAITLAPELTGPRTLFARINTGGPTVTVDGQTWQSDKSPVIFTPATSPDEFPNTDPIANTTLDRVYQDYRGQVPGAPSPDQRFLTYSIPLPSSGPQKVAVRLHFAERYWGLAGRPGLAQRLFDVEAEGQMVLDDFDIFGAAGGAANTAVIIPIENVQVNDGVLTLRFHTIRDNISIAGIEVFKQPDNAPVANAGPDQKVELGAAVTLVGDAFDNSPPQTYQWRQISGTAVTLSNNGAGQTVTFTAPATRGILVFELTVTNALGLSGTDTVQIQVGDIPIAGLAANNNSPKVINEVVTFGATVTAGDDIVYAWDFGDGATGAGAAATHIYVNPGTYTATLSATNDAGTVTATTSVVILAEPPFELRINSGGPAYTDDQGRSWIADLNSSTPRYSSAGTSYTNTNAGLTITGGAPNPTIYRSERYANNFNYNIPVPAADDYLVTLHFAEIFYGAPGGGAANGTRRFDVNILDPVVPAGAEPELNDLNLRVQYGPAVAFKQTYTVRVADGQININLDSRAAAGGADNAKISGIEVVRVINGAPLVNAGPDQTVLPGTLVQLSGTVSDPENTATTFTWAQTGGPAATLANATTLTPSFTPAAKGAYTFKLTGRDADGYESSDLVVITASNRAPTVTATATPATVDVGQASALAATASDPDGDTLSYSWAKTGGPAGGTLTGQTTANASFTPAAKGTYTFTVTVNDGDSGTATATVTLTVNNRVPTVTATATPATVDVGQASALAATASDPDGDTLSYSWAQTGGPAGGTLTGQTTANASFTPAAKGTYTFTVTVSDGDGGTATATATVTVRNRAPEANAGNDRTVDVGATVALNGGASSDPDGDTLTYAWTQTAGPAVTLTGATTAAPTFVAPGLPTTLTFELTVSDSENLQSAADSVTITVAEIPIDGLTAGSDSPTVLGQLTTFTADAPVGSNVTYSWEFGDGATGSGDTATHTYAATGTYTATLTATNSVGTAEIELLVTVTNATPTADAGPDQNVTVGAVVTLDGGDSDDADNHTPLTYSWTQNGTPAVTLTGDDTAAPTFTAPATPAVLVFELVVTDSRGLASPPDSVVITVSDSEPQDVTANNDGPTVLGQVSTLSAQATGTNLVYSWTFGDGATGSGATATHTYAAEGTYVATVTVTNGSSTVGSASTAVEVTNTAPLPSPGPDQAVDVGVTVTLDGTASNDPDGHTPLTYLWAQLSGPAVTLAGANNAIATFTAPNVQASLVFALTVTDSRGKSDSATVRVVVGDEAIAGLQATSSSPTVLGQATSFSASISGGTNVTYSWNFGGGRTATGANVEFTFAAEGSYPVTVTATNPLGSESRTLTAVVTNSAPAVDGGADQNVRGNSLVTLRGSASDVDGHTPMTYRWAQVGTPTVTLAGANTATATFTAPNVDAVLTFSLTVTDGRGKAATDTVRVTIRAEVVAPDTYNLFLPMLSKGSGISVATPADLVVGNLTVTPANLAPGVPAQLSVTVTNRGGTAAGAFWVDMYINPRTPPAAAGVTWDMTCTLDPCQGAAWLVRNGLAPGESIVLTLDPASYYGPNSRWYGNFVAGTNAIYVYADSWNLSNPAGIVVEQSETNNRAQLIRAGAGQPQQRSTEVSPPDLPARTLP